MPQFGTQGRGDLYLRLRVTVPEELTSKERELYQQLRLLEQPGTRRVSNRRVRSRDATRESRDAAPVRHGSELAPAGSVREVLRRFDRQLA